MSRSFKHAPITKGGSRISKRQANKIVRQRLKDINYEIGNFTHYKSIVESWDIAEYKCYCPTDTKIYRK
jgi:hypothetical protein